MKIKSRNVLYLDILYILISSGISMLILIDDNRPVYYENLWLLPLFFGIVVFLLLLRFPSTWKNISALFIIGLFSIRNIATPLFMRLGKYTGIFRMLTVENVNYALIMMLFESIVIVIYVFYLANCNRRRKSTTRLEKYNWSLLFFIVCVAFIIAYGVIRPDFFTTYTTIFDFNNIRNTKDLSLLSRSTHGFFGLFRLIFPMAYLYISLFIMSRVNKNKMPLIIKTIINILLISIPFLFMDSSNLFTIICVLCLGCASLKTGGISKKLFFVGIGAGIILMVLSVFLLIVRRTLTSSFTWLEGISKFSQAYLPGVCNFAGFFNINKHDKLSSLFYDFLVTIPGHNTFFQFGGEGRLVVLYNQDNSASDQIIPCFCQLFYYTYLLAPFLESLFVKKSFQIYERINSSDNIYDYFTNVLLYVFLIITPVAYNATIFFARYFSTILPMGIVAGLISRKELSS